MQDPLTSSFRWGETFDTAPLYQKLQHRSFNDNGGVSIVHLSFERGRRLGILLSSDAKDVFRQVRFEVCKSDYLEAFSTLFASRSGVLRG